MRKFQKTLLLLFVLFAATFATCQAQQVQDAAKFGDQDVRFNYEPDVVYKIYTAPERLTEIRLQPGERIRAMFGGDTETWKVEQAITTTDNGPTQYSLFIKPIADNTHTTVFISTDRRVYRIVVYSTNWYNGIIRWAYPRDEQIAKKRALARLENALTMIPTDTSKMNTAYKIIAKDNYPWKPVSVFDYEGKTYIKLGDKTAVTSMPVLFVKEGKELQMVNSRVQQEYFIADRLANEFQLVNGKEVVIIKKQQQGGKR